MSNKHKDPAVLFYISDWLTSTAEMSADCRGWYLNLILHNYDKGSLPNDLETLATLCFVKKSEHERFEQVFEQVLKHKFKLNENNRLTNDKTEIILRGREMFKEKRSNSGKLSYLLKYFRENHSKQCTSKFENFVKENVDINTIETKNEQMLEQVFEQMFELYRNENRNENNKELIIVEFDKFWNLYNKKEGDKDACKNKFAKLTDAERNKIFETLPTFLSNIKDKQFQPMPSSYLNQKRWNDELVPKVEVKKSSIPKELNQW